MKPSPYKRRKEQGKVSAAHAAAVAVAAALGQWELPEAKGCTRPGRIMHTHSCERGLHKCEQTSSARAHVQIQHMR